MQTLTITLTSDAIEHLSKWLEALYLTGNLTRDDPAYVFTALIVRALQHGETGLIVTRTDLTR